MTHHHDDLWDGLGVGIGPFNLSVAALSAPLSNLRLRFFERQPEFQWHPGLLFPEATIQVSFLKDLVTLADPTSRYSFLNFLFTTGRLYRFLNVKFTRVSRVEFNEYMRWVCASLPNLEFRCGVNSVSCDDKSLLVELEHRVLRTRNLILGSGLAPMIPTCARPHLGDRVFHASQFLRRFASAQGRRLAVIGGGQTGAEVIYYILARHNLWPSQLHWITRRPNFLPLDESPFTNELFTPNYSDYFFHLTPEQKARLLAEQKLASDGVCQELLEKIYQRLYEMDFLESQQRRYQLYSCAELVAIQRLGSEDGPWRLKLQNAVNGREMDVEADVVVLCTGYEYQTPVYLEPLRERIRWEHGGYVLREDFSIEWDGPDKQKIFVQNAARHSRGVADPNLSLMAWRGAKILNSMVGFEHYPVGQNSAVFDWTMELESVMADVGRGSES
jgi:lysine N6-hydroxylase